MQLVWKRQCCEHQFRQLGRVLDAFSCAGVPGKDVDALERDHRAQHVSVGEQFGDLQLGSKRTAGQFFAGISSSAVSSSAASSPAVPGKASSAALLKITVQKSEVPQGYEAKPYQADPGDAASQAALVRCIGGTDTTKDKTGEAHSPDYTLQNAQIASQAESFRSKKDVDADVALISSPVAGKCYEKLFTERLGSSLPGGATITKVSIKINTHPAGLPKNVVGIGSGVITVAANGQTVNVNLGVAFITGPLVQAEVDFVNVNAPIPAALQTALVKKVAARAAAG